ncbi:hypothetical protein DRJ25_05260 [Candidatus Woesearchaeota archaeon]|nr:MAG: hypothetical protein DRJ25_05260 [Candidatus Woesearchaeota archaeon]
MEDRLDSSQLLFFTRQLEVIKKTQYNEKNKLLFGASLIPVDPEVRGEGIETVTYRSYSKIGVASFIGDYGGSIPRADMFGTEVSAHIKRLASSYGYSIFEIKKAIRSGVNLKSGRADAAFRAVAEKVDDIIWNGDAKRNLQGFLNYPGIQEYTTPDGAGGNPEWSDKTPAEIYADMRAMVKTPYINTKQIEKPDTLLLPTEQYELIRDIQFSVASDLTVMEYFKRNNPEVTVLSIPDLAGAGDGGVDRMMAYVRDASHLTQLFPVPTKQEKEFQETPFTYVIPVWAEHGGVIIYYPQSVIFADFI